MEGWWVGEGKGGGKEEKLELKKRNTFDWSGAASPPRGLAVKNVCLTAAELKRTPSQQNQANITTAHTLGEEGKKKKREKRKPCPLHHPAGDYGYTCATCAHSCCSQLYALNASPEKGDCKGSTGVESTAREKELGDRHASCKRTIRRALVSAGVCVGRGRGSSDAPGWPRTKDHRWN